MQFYINVTGCNSCCLRSVKSLLTKYKYKFTPSNKKFYLVNTQQKTCVGVDSPTLKIDTFKAEGTSYTLLGKKLVNK
jgi:hypothetical protein